MYQGAVVDGETGSKVLPHIVARHASEAAFLWELRDAAVSSPAYDLPALGKLDDRVDANLDGLRIAGDFGWETGKAALAEPGAGEVFAATVLAVERGDTKALVGILALVVRYQALARGLISALGWVSLKHAERYLKELLAGDASPELRYLGIAGCAIHRYNPGASLESAAGAADMRLRARALRAIGELGCRDMLSELRREIDSEHEGCQFWAAWSTALLGDPAATEVLWRLARREGPFADRACDMVMRCVAPAIAQVRVRELATMDGRDRRALVGAAALGDAALVPWVLDCMRTPEKARFAGWVFVMITGIDLHAQRLAGSAPAGFRAGPTDDPDDPNVTPDPDARLPWPDVSLVRSWWEKNGHGFPAGPRLLLGKAIDEAWCGQVMRNGTQPARAAAAVELCLTRKEQPLFEVRAPAFRQASAFVGSPADDWSDRREPVRG